MITLKEGLLNKKNINSIDKYNFYLIFPFGIDQKHLNNDFSDCWVHKHWGYFIIPKQRLESKFGSVQNYLLGLSRDTGMWEINAYDRERIIKLIENILGSPEKTKDEISKLKNFKRIK